MIGCGDRFAARLGEDDGFVVEYDDRRFGWFFRGLGFDFFAHPIMDDLFEARVCRADDDVCVHISIPVGPSGLITADVFASAALKALSRYWFIEGSPYTPWHLIGGADD
jgi:hypothetical protein